MVRKEDLGRARVEGFWSEFRRGGSLIHCCRFDEVIIG